MCLHSISIRVCCPVDQARGLRGARDVSRISRFEVGHDGAPAGTDAPPNHHGHMSFPKQACQLQSVTCMFVNYSLPCQLTYKLVLLPLQSFSQRVRREGSSCEPWLPFGEFLECRRRIGRHNTKVPVPRRPSAVGTPPLLSARVAESLDAARNSPSPPGDRTRVQKSWGTATRLLDR